MLHFLPSTGNLVILAVHGVNRHRPVLFDPTAVIIYESTGNALQVIRTWFTGKVLPQLKHRIELGQATSLGVGSHQFPPLGNNFTAVELQSWSAKCGALFDPVIRSEAYHIFDNLFVDDLSGISGETLEKPMVFKLHVRHELDAEYPPQLISQWAFSRKVTTEEYVG